jgi:hypothetical protein
MCALFLMTFLCDFLPCFVSLNILIVILSQSTTEVSLNSLINVITCRSRLSVCCGNHKYMVDGQIAELGDIRRGGLHSYNWNSKD